jgi:hypothetical protein
LPKIRAESAQCRLRICARQICKDTDWFPRIH